MLCRFYLSNIQFVIVYAFNDFLALLNSGHAASPVSSASNSIRDAVCHKCFGAYSLRIVLGWFVCLCF
jgi:hypothetical protein